jgi:multidrug resistance efflux pump
MTTTEVIPAKKVEKKQRGRRFLRSLRTFVVVLILIAGAAAGGYYVVEKRLAAQTYVEVGSAVLTASPVNVSTSDGGVVTTLLVGPAGAGGTGPGTGVRHHPGQRHEADRDQIVRAPSMGTVAAVNVAIGNVTHPASP